MTYHDEPYWECNSCGKLVDESDYLCTDWESEWYDKHYCPDCIIKRKEAEEREIQYQKDIESGKIKIKKQRLPQIPKWCPKLKGFLFCCKECGRMPNDCPYTDMINKKGWIGGK